MSADSEARRFHSLENVNPEDSIIIELPVLKEKFKEWKQRSLDKNKTLQDFIDSAVEGHILREDIILYLEKQAEKKPWWKKRQYNL